MTLPASIAADIEHHTTHAGEQRKIVASQAVGGGCISPAARLEFDDGAPAFVKWSTDRALPDDFFAAEARSLRALAAAGAVRVPGVHAVSRRWILLEWLEPGRPTPGTWDHLGASLAQLHRVRHDAFGWESDNYIGSLPQRNRRHDAWPGFWREERLLPQWQRAREAGLIDRRHEPAFQRLLARTDALLRPGTAEGASLLHGDLWIGNVHVMADGKAALVDASSSCGHREVDLAMAELFGGFDRAFFHSYQTAWPLQPGYAEARRSLYQLYYLLVHVNHFGQNYVEWTLRVVGELG